MLKQLVQAINSQTKTLGLNQQVLGNNPQGTVVGNTNTSLNISLDMENDMNLSVVIGHSAYDYVDGLDADYGPLVLVSRDDWSEYDKDSVELRLSSDQPICQMDCWCILGFSNARY